MKKKALYAQSGDYVNSMFIENKNTAVRPVSNLNLSSVLFASGAEAPSSGTATSGIIAPGTAMTLRLDGSSQNIGTVTYNTTTGDIKATKGSTAGNVALVVQGNDGTNDWYYSKQIEGTEILNVSDIEAEYNTPASVDLSACKIWLETTDSTERIIYAVYATETTVRIIHSVAITDINATLKNTALDTEAACATTGVSSTTPSVTWTPEHTTAGYNTSYIASATLSAAAGYEFTDSTTATVNGSTATSVTKNDDGTLTVTYTFPATAKDTLLSITTPQPITVPNGTSYEDMNLPETVAIVTEGRTVTSAPVVWDIDTPESGSYNPNILTEQTVTLNGTVTCPDDIDDNRVSLTTTITITINAADTVEAPQANPASGTYTSNQWVELSSATQGAEIYYTLDGTTPSRTNGTKYTGPISVTGTEAQSVDTTIKAIAVKDRMQDSSVETFTYTIKIPDTTVPTGEIKIDTNKWTEFLNDITFGLFFKDTQTVTITASDNSGEAVTIEYLLSDKGLTAAELDNATFTVYNNTFKINPDNKYVIYAKLTDTSGNVTYLSSDGIVMDSVIPVISGVENGKTYCEAQTVTVTEDYIESVKVNGDAVTLDTNSQFTLTPATGTQTIVATDKAGNVSAEITVTVNAEHTYEWRDDNGHYWKKCKFCGDETVKKDIPTITINGADSVCVTQDYKFSFTLPQGATDAVYGYEFENKGDLGLPAIVENNELFGIVPVMVYEPSENSFKVYAGAKTADGFDISASKIVALKSKHTDAEPKDHICDICGATLSEHTGGEATCRGKAICEYCGNEYGELDSTNHNLENIPAKAATVTETGNKEYWCCLDCGKYFSDKDGKNSIELKDTVTQKLPPEIIEGTGQSLTAGEKKELTFRSNAAFGDFIRVELDGKTLDEKNYTVKEGSTVVTLKADYVGALSAGEHTIGIVSTSGTAATTFTINAKMTVDNNTKAPQTGDNSMMWLWVALLFVSVGGVIGTTVVRKKKKYSNNKN